MRVAFASCVLSLLTASTILEGCHRSPPPTARDAPLADAGPALQSKDANVRGVRLNYLDWGGTGEPLVFLAGLGATAHAFDDFAPRFTNRHHVIAVSRRGSGGSERTAEGYDTASLVEDLRALFDELHIAKANVVAHSFGGAELTCLAATYPDRVARAVYLDAAYDHPKGMAVYQRFPDSPQPPKASAVDTSSVTAYAAYMERVYGYAMPPAEIDAQFALSEQGARPRVEGKVFGALIAGESLCPYAAVKAPALAIFAALDGPGDLARFLSADAETEKRAEPLWREMAAFDRAAVDTFTREAPRGTVLVLHAARHWVFQSNAAEVERAMREALAR